MTNTIKTISRKQASLFSLLILMILAGCSKDDDGGSPTAELTLNIIGLERLASDSSYEYEAWIVVDGDNKSLGRFTTISFPKTFTVNADMLENASEFKLSIELGNDPSSAISESVLLSGMFRGNSADLNISESIGNFTQAPNIASGKYVLYTPTDNDPDNNQNGIYFYDPQADEAGLKLPILPEGWKYEGWVVIPTNQGEVMLSTGTFRNPDNKDDFAPYSASANQLPSNFYPGEDFLNMSILGQFGINSTPDLRNKDIFISIEPSPDNKASEPFVLRPLTSESGSELFPITNSMNLNTASFPSGRVDR
ncbi:MAG: hypothetical protein WBG71_09385 [Leeuwenhoekiella sp.]